MKPTIRVAFMRRIRNEHDETELIEGTVVSASNLTLEAFLRPIDREGPWKEYRDTGGQFIEIGSWQRSDLPTYAPEVRISRRPDDPSDHRRFLDLELVAFQRDIDTNEWTARYLGREAKKPA